MTRFYHAAAAALMCCACTVHAAEEDEHADGKPVKIDFKLTTSWYRSSDSNNANDINLRGNYGDHAAWFGQYRDHQNYQQSRAGYEFTQHLGASQIVWSAQAADGGFLGGSITAQLGDPIFGIVGFGRTNLNNYYNLNFDPNDAITLGLGTHINASTDLSLFQIHDDRLGTRQRVTHLYLHRTLSHTHRYSIDASYKTGLNSDGNDIKGVALTVTVAYRQYFLRLAHDQYANFSAATQHRISFGIGF